MIRNEKIIRRLTLEERVNLVVSSEMYKNQSFSYYQFPIFDLMKDPLNISKEVESTILPSRRMVASTWNPDLFEAYGRLIGEENACVSQNMFFKESGVLSSDITSNATLLSSFVSNYARGINATQSRFILEIEESSSRVIVKKEIENIVYEDTLKNSNLKYVLIHDVNDIYEFNKTYKYSGRYFAKGRNPIEISKFINGGVDFVYYVGGDYPSVVKGLIALGEKYTEYKAMVKNGQVSEEDFQELLDKGQILSLEKLSTCCDRMIDLLNDVTTFRNKNELNPIGSEDKNDVLETICHEGTILLKNDRNLLPLNRSKKMVLLGDVVKNDKYYIDGSTNTPDVIENIFQEAEQCELINCIGYAHGYHKGTPTKENLLKVGVELLKKADVGVCFLKVDEETKTLPEEQVDFLRACYYEARKPIVAVVYGSMPIDLSLIDLCSSVLLIENQSFGFAKNIIDMLVGNVQPSGRLTFELSKEEQVVVEEDLDNIVEKQHAYHYPVGYGLSYTDFAYSNLEVTSEGVRFTLTNTGENDGTEVVQLYVEKETTSTTLIGCQLKAFKKVFVKKGDAVKVFIPFDEKTFRYYDTVNKCFGVEGGEYLLYIGSSIKEILLRGSIKLNRCLDEGFGFNKEVEELTVNDLHQFVAPINKASHKRKVTIGVLLCIYINLSLLVLIITNFSTNIEELVLCGALGGLMLLFNIFIGVYFSKLKKTKEVVQNVDVNESLTLLMDKVQEFDVSSRYVYENEEEVEETEEVELPEVVEEEVQETEEELPEDSTYENEIEEEEVVDISETTLSREEIELHEREQIQLMEEQEHEDLEEFGDEDENVVYDNESSIHAICDRLMSYSKKRGIIIELSSCRQLISSLLSSHIVIANSKSKELVNDFLVILNDYFGNRGHITTANDTWNSSFYLAWKKDESGAYVKTDFVNDVHNANKYKNSINISFITNVNATNVETYLKEIIDFANKPSYVHHLRLNQKQVIKVPANTRFVLVPNNESYLSDASKELIDASVSVELLLRKADQVEEVDTPNQVSYAHILEQIGVSKKEFFLSEDTWKHIDSFINDVNAIESFAIGNKTIIQIEKYVSILMECGSDEQDALDAILTSKLVPLIKTLKVYQDENGERTFIKLFERHFGKENISKTIRALKKYVPVQE